MVDDMIRPPKIDHLLREEWVNAYGHRRVVQHARYWVECAREDMRAGRPIDLDAIRSGMASSLADGLSAVINGTGVLLHTNLGRAPWSDRARATAVAAMGYCTVEFDLKNGRRGQRGAAVENRLQALTGAPAALVVNNCAGAVLLMLSALAKGRRVLVSRGELVEIGGGFRVPDVMAASGCELMEIGTTNKTHLRDFEQALDESVAGVLRVHHSNFKQIGFTTQPTMAELGALDAPLWVDLGSGQLPFDQDEPSVAEALKAGAEVICFSGDKLLGGPQTGIILGQDNAIERIRRHPMYRAMRPDKVVLAALEGTIDDHLRGQETPVERMRHYPLDDLRDAAQRTAATLCDLGSIEVVDTHATLGGGSLPGSEIPSVGLAITGQDPESLRRACLAADPPLIGRIQDDTLIFDLRTILPLAQGETFEQTLGEVLKAVPS